MDHHDNNNNTTTTFHLHVSGMMCQKSCGSTVQQALLTVPGVCSAEASFATSSAVVTANSHVTADQLVEAIDDVGFDARLQSPAQQPNINSNNTDQRTVYLAVDGMMCQRNCGTTVRNALLAVDGVLQAEASFATQQAWAMVSASKYEHMQDELVEAIEDVGFDCEILTEEQARDLTKQAQLQQQLEAQQQKQTQQRPEQSTPPPPPSSSCIVLQVEGMSCAVCTGKVERSLMQVEGVTSAFVSLATHRAEIFYDDLSTPDQLEDLALRSQQRVQQVGYPCDILSTGVGGNDMTLQDNAQQLEDAKHKELRQWRRLLLLSLTLTIPMIVIQHILMQKMIDEDGKHNHNQLNNNHHSTTSTEDDPNNDMSTMIMSRSEAYQFTEICGQYMLALAILSTLVQTMVGYRYYKAAWKAGTDFGMDFLVVMGTTSSYVYSVIVWLWILTDQDDNAQSDTTLEPTFGTGAMLLTFVTFGKFLEAYAKGKTSSALQALMKLQPMWASRVVGNTEALEAAENDDASSKQTPLNLSALDTEEISAWDVQVGDYLKVLPGSRIPADGIVVALSSTSNNSSGMSSKQNNNKLSPTLTASSSGSVGSIGSAGSFGSQQSSAQVAYIDESAFSGEPFPVPKAIGDSVYGSSVNQLSVLVIRVTATGSNSVLAKIVKLMEEAQRRKAPIQALADKIASVFAPAVLGLAVLTFVTWALLNTHAATQEERWFMAFMSAISVIVVACPCALGLATPTAVMVGTGVGATHGLLIKGGSVLEEMQAIDTIVWDKTGTITTGKAVLGEHIELVKNQQDLILQNLPSKVAEKQNSVALWLAACAEMQSEHPLAKAIVNAAKGKFGGDVTCSYESVDVQDFFVAPGSGVECVVSKPGWGTYVVRVGNKHWCQEPVVRGERAGESEDPLVDSMIAPVLDDQTGDQEIAHLRQIGQIGVYVSVLNGRAMEEVNLLENDLSAQPPLRRQVIGILGIVDPIKADAKSTIAALRSLGLDVWLCTGDHETTARAVAQQVCIDEDNVCAGAKPEDKAALVTRLQSRWNGRGNKRRHVACIGDGINDAVMLARADVGVAIGAGTEVAVEAADVVLVRSNLHDVVIALHLSRVCFRRIRMNFIWAMSYNLLALPFAAGILYPFTDFTLPPEYAGLMMAFSSVSVVTSSLLLRNYRRPVILEDGTLDGGSGILHRLMRPFEGRVGGGMKNPLRSEQEYETLKGNSEKETDIELV